MEWFDTHAHLDDDSFDEIRDNVVQRAVDAGVQTMIAVGTTHNASRRCVEIASQYQAVYASVGIQPNYCHEVEAGDWDSIVDLAKAPGVVALGETGLDRYWDHCPFDVQQDYFQRHLALSQETGLPFIVHMRDCETDIIEALEIAVKNGPLNGVMHSFTGTATGIERCVELGMYISFAGMVTFKKSDELRAIAKLVPDDRLLIETDSPYLSPHPKRGQRPNEPALVVLTGECLAEVRGMPAAELATLTTNNARRFFKL